MLAQPEERSKVGGLDIRRRMSTFAHHWPVTWELNQRESAPRVPYPTDLILPMAVFGNSKGTQPPTRVPMVE